MLPAARSSGRSATAFETGVNTRGVTAAAPVLNDAAPTRPYPTSFADPPELRSVVASLARALPRDRIAVVPAAKPDMWVMVKCAPAPNGGSQAIPLSEPRPLMAALSALQWDRPAIHRRRFKNFFELLIAGDPLDAWAFWCTGRRI